MTICRTRHGGRIAVLVSLLALLMGAHHKAEAATTGCRIEGLPNELQCGVLKRPLDPARADGPQIEIHYLVVPAMARNKQPDPVLMLAGGPGQSAIGVAPMVMNRLARLNNRRDLVFIDQRGTGKSAPLQCADESRLSLAEVADEAASLRRIEQCREQLQKLPHGDLRFYSTTLAMQDFDAVRAELGAERWNLIGGSYGTRAALEYQRQFPQRVRRTVIDGVAPPDLVLPESLSADVQAALDAELKACEDEPACAKRYPQLRQQWSQLLASLPRTVSVRHPLTNEPESFTLTRTQMLRTIRGPLYVPSMTSLVPAAIQAATKGQFEALAGLGSMMGSNKGTRLALGMHFSVICAEDAPRMGKGSEAPGRDTGRVDAELYERVCKTWPRAEVPAAFYQVPPAQTPVLLLSGGADPVTPPRHAERIAKLLGAKTQHIVVPQAGHGVMSLGCMGEVLYRFIDAKTDAAALPQDAGCAVKIPRPPAFQPIIRTEVQP
ncbi:alpha/beta hydrolase [Mitsuaria sp. WAJ17]|uniref:alpha/beta hydrolase n=1 Tax=Mitsuaria sp. WAJ17 TaxID=2761452 RepID=UPI0016006DEA|nr:alpha/beta hydrolase [Mitsuaria sp. WAJ17]MBB2483767.1 alpha/beta hydrolase [Mitsuaria sp. WAJ17]